MEKITVTADSKVAQAKIGEHVSVYVYSSNRDIAGMVVKREEKEIKISNGCGGKKRRQVVVLTIDTAN